MKRKSLVKMKHRVNRIGGKGNCRKGQPVAKVSCGRWQCSTEVMVHMGQDRVRTTRRGKQS